MIAILPADDSQRRLLFEKAALCCDDSGRAMVLTDAGSAKGSILYRLEGQAVRLLTLSCTDPVDAEGLIRAALNAAQREGARTGFCAGGEWEVWAERLGFLPEKEGFAVSLSEFFARKCCQER